MREKQLIRLQPMDYRDVTLSAGRFKEQYEEVLEYFLAIPNDDILLGFRRRAGLAAPGNELGGWYSNDGSYDVYEWDEIFNPFGQWLSFLGRAYAVSRQERIREKAAFLMREWGKTIDEDGYFFYSNQCNGHHYSYEKIQGGLTDLYLYAGLEDAKALMDKITSWAKRELPRTRKNANMQNRIFSGGDPAIKLIDTEWYTLSENLYRIYVATGDEQYKDFAMEWHYDGYWDALCEGNADIMTRVHGYSHVNNLGGAAYAYRVVGDEKYLQTITKGYEILKEYQLLASGGYAFDEQLADPCGSNYRDVETIAQSFESPCGSWAAFKLVRHLISLTGCAQYGEWAETILYNAIGAALPMKDDSQRRGKTFYYADYRIGGGRKVYFSHSFPCCSGTYPQAIAEYYNLIYYKDVDCLYISQYIPSTVSTNIGNKCVQVEIKGNYPVDDHFEVVVGCAGFMRIALRIPSWLQSGAKILINGDEQNIALIAGEWAVIKREWTLGDVIKAVFPMKLRTHPIAKQHPERAALLYGPVLLASEGRNTKLKGCSAKPEEIAQKGKGLRFVAECENGDRVLLRPLWEYAEREWYTLYHDLDG